MKTVPKKQTKNYTKRKKKKDPRKLLILLVLSLVIIFVIINKEDKVIYNEKLSLIKSNENITNNLNNEIIIKDNIVYLSYEDIKNNFDDDIYQEDDTIVMSSDKKIAALQLNNNNIEINGSNIKINGQAYKNEHEIVYIPISDLQNVYDMQLTYSAEYKNIAIDFLSNKLEKAYTKKDLSLKKEKKNSSDTIEKLKKDDWVIYISEEDGWSKVRSQNGNIGYIKKNNLTNFTTERENFEQNKDIKETTYSKDISKKNISNYKNRKKVIDEILLEAVTKKQQTISITYKKDKESEEFKRFKVESSAILKECGITVKWD